MLHTKLAPWPRFSEDEAELAKQIILSNKVNYWTGDEGRTFEKEFASYIGTEYAIALANGSLALELALRSLGVGPGDEVIVTPRSFLASVSCVVNVGATPIFADVEISNGNLSASTIEMMISEKTKAVVCVHLSGWACDMDPIMNLADKHEFFVVEDCAQAHGAEYKGKKVGSIGHVGAYSFCQDKIMTTAGEGGVLTTNDSTVWQKAWAYKDHGKSWSAVYDTEHPTGFRWLHESFGSNFRMTEIQAAIGRSQLKQVESWVSRRQELAEKLDVVAKQFSSLRVEKPSANFKVAPYKHYMYVEAQMLKKDWSRDRILEVLNYRDVPCFMGSCPEIYLEKAFQSELFPKVKRLKNARQLGETSLCFLVHPTITDEQMEWVTFELHKVMKEATIN